MGLLGKKVTRHDMSLRDGMNAKHQQTSIDEVVSIATGLDDAGVPLVGDFLYASNLDIMTAEMFAEDAFSNAITRPERG